MYACEVRPCLLKILRIWIWAKRMKYGLDFFNHSSINMAAAMARPPLDHGAISRAKSKQDPKADVTPRQRASQTLFFPSATVLVSL